jgi:sarcosine oxidase delta subunit
MRASLGLLFCASVVFGTTGCGGLYYAIEGSAASSRVAEAREVGAEQLAPYEYYYAKAHLEQAASEASQGHYSDAAAYAETAADTASKAIEIARAAGGKKKEER